MNALATRTSFCRVSLRELLLLFGFLAVGCAALKYPGPAWWAALAACILLLFMASAVAALVDRGRRQAVATGCAVCLATYGSVFKLATTELPTETLLHPLYQAMVTHTWIDITTRQVLPNDPSYTMKRRPPNVAVRQTPDRTEFMSAGHLLWTLLFGYLGGRFAGWVYDRRTRREESTGETVR